MNVSELAGCHFSGHVALLGVPYLLAGNFEQLAEILVDICIFLDGRCRQH